MTGPIAMPMPEKLAQMPIALPRSDGSNTFVMTESVCGCTSAAPIPISARVPISWPGVEANAEATEARPNTTMPTTRNSRRPNRSPSTPALNISPAKTSVYELIAHSIWDWVAPRSAWMVFRATLRIVLSRMTTSRHTTSTARISQRRRCTV